MPGQAGNETARRRLFAKAIAEEAFDEAAELSRQWRYDLPADWSQDRQDGRDIAAAEIVDAIRARAREVADGKL